MTGEDALVELRDNILRDRSDSVAGASDLFWTNSQLITYINDGIDRFLSLTRMVIDNASALTTITLETGVDTYKLDPRINRVLSASLSGRAPMTPSSFDALGGSPGHTVAARYGSSSFTGEPRFFSLDEATGFIRFSPIPGEAENGVDVVLRCTRTAHKRLTADNLSGELEIPSLFQLDVLEWAAYRALRNHDADAENMAKAEKHKQRFDEAVAEGRQYVSGLINREVRFAPKTRWS